MVYVFILVFWALWGMSNGVEWTLQAEKMDLHVSWLPWISMSFAPFYLSAGWGLDLLAAQVQTANPILILLFVPIVNYVIYPAIDKFFPLTPLRKIGIGLFITASLVCRDRLDPGTDRFGIKAEHQLAVARLHHSHSR